MNFARIIRKLLSLICAFETLTAPSDGTYSYYLATYLWGDQGTAVDVNANGQWKDMLRYETVSANCPSTRRTVELKAGQIGWKPRVEVENV